MIRALVAYTALVVLVLAQLADAQVRPVGLIWDIPESTPQARAELEVMRQNGITHVYTTSVPQDELLQLLRNYQVHLLAQHRARYLTAAAMERNGAAIQADILQEWNRIRVYPHLTGYSLFFEGALFRPDFLGLAATLRPAGMSDQHAFFVSDMSPPEGYSVPMSRVGLVQTMDEAPYQLRQVPDAHFLVMVDPSESTDIAAWYELFKTAGSGRLYIDSKIYFVDSEFHTSIRQLIGDIQSDPEYLLPIRQREDSQALDGYSVVVFLIILVIFGIHYAFDPTYRKSLQRFVMSNRIFVDDLVQRRAKLTFSNYIVAAYVIILSGAFVMSIAEFSVSRSGVELIASFIPLIDAGNLLFYAFLAGCAASALVLALLIPWGAYMNKGTTHVMSYTTIMLWPNHFLFIFIMVAIVMSRAFNSAQLTAMLGVVFVAVPVLSYTYAGFKLIRYSFRSGLPYMILYFIPPFAIIASLIWWLLTNTTLFQLAELIIYLP